MSSLVEVKVPDIGDYKNIPIIEILVKPGDVVKAEDSLVTLESDKATMEVPSPAAGTVKEVKVKVGDKVSEGVLVVLLEAVAAAPASGPAAPQQAAAPAPTPVTVPAADAPAPAPSPATLPTRASADIVRPSVVEAPVRDVGTNPHASPSVRRLGREFGVDLTQVTGTGPKTRILKEDVQAYVKSRIAGASTPATAGSGFNVLPMPQVDFSKFGAVTQQPLSRIRKLSGANLHRNWVTIPHVTQNEEADVTELEAFRRAQSADKGKPGPRLTMLAFLMKASVAALKQFPDFNASLSSDGESLVLKQYFHIGVAVDTPSGLVVPVIRDVDRKGVIDLAGELAAVSERMRAGKISPTDLQGGCFSISSLGGIGGTYFTPIINAPEVAILGVSRATIKPVWNGKEFAPRLMLPLSLSYDHRVIDGAQGARFISYLSGILGDIRRLVL